MRRMEQDTEQDRTDQADTNQKNACGKSESENRRRPDCGESAPSIHRKSYTLCLAVWKITCITIPRTIGFRWRAFGNCYIVSKTKNRCFLFMF